MIFKAIKPDLFNITQGYFAAVFGPTKPDIFNEMSGLFSVIFEWFLSHNMLFLNLNQVFVVPKPNQTVNISLATT